MKKYIPTYLAKDIYSINPDFFHLIEKKFLFIDLDNTLDGPHIYDPSKRTVDLIQKLIKAGLIPIIISNNNKKRVQRYAKTLNIKYVYRAFKPFSINLKKYAKQENISLNSVIIIGDQVMTDIICANKLGVLSILTEPLTNSDQVITFINRKLDSHYRKKIINGNLSQSWEDIYAKFQQS